MFNLIHIVYGTRDEVMKGRESVRQFIRCVDTSPPLPPFFDSAFVCAPLPSSRKPSAATPTLALGPRPKRHRSLPWMEKGEKKIKDFPSSPPSSIHSAEQRQKPQPPPPPPGNETHLAPKP